MPRWRNGIRGGLKTLSLRVRLPFSAPLDTYGVECKDSSTWFFTPVLAGWSPVNPTSYEALDTYTEPQYTPAVKSGDHEVVYSPWRYRGERTGWGPWRRDWFSFCSIHTKVQGDCTACNSGSYANRWWNAVESVLYAIAPGIWRWWANR